MGSLISSWLSTLLRVYEIFDSFSRWGHLHLGLLTPSWFSPIVIWPSGTYAFVAMSLRYNVRIRISRAHWRDLIQIRTRLAVGKLFTLETDISMCPMWHIASQRCCVFRGFEMPYHSNESLSSVASKCHRISPLYCGSLWLRNTTPSCHSSVSLVAPKCDSVLSQ